MSIFHPSVVDDYIVHSGSEVSRVRKASSENKNNESKVITDEMDEEITRRARERKTEKTQPT